MKTSKFLFPLILLANLFNISCATTSIEYVNNPEIQISSFKRIMIFAPFQDLGMRKNMENYFVEELIKNGKDAVSSISIMPPIRTYTNEELTSLLSDASIDAVLSVAIVDAYTKQVYVPPTSTTTGKAQVYGNTIYGQSTTYTSGGNYINKPRVKFEMNLYNAINGQLGWKATALTKGNAHADTNTLFKSLAVRVAKEYILQP